MDLYFTDAFHELSDEDKQEIIITFLSVLDLMRLLEIVIYQNNLFGDIEIHRLEKN